MTQWTPDWKLTINGLDYTSKAIASVTHNAGRRDIYQQPTASYLQVEIVDLNDMPYTFNINDGLTLEVKDSAGNYVVIFGGNITDINPQIKRSGTVTNVISYTLIALGSIAKLTKAVTNGVLAKDFDGDQIWEILAGILYDTWSEVPAATQWNTFDPTKDWTDAFNSGLGEIDRPGDYELHERSADPINTYSLVSQLATSGLGYIYEDAEGRICYADSTHRSQYLTNNGYVDLTGNDAIAPGMTSQTRSSDIRNEITINYKNNQSISVLDATSQSLYGIQGSVIQTSLENGADATSQGNFYLAIRAYPAQNLSSITYALQNPELSDADRDALLNVFMGMPLNITDLPPAIVAGGRYQGFVEGWNFRTSYNGLYLTLYLSPISYSLQAYRWNSVANTETWNTLNPTMDWNTATIVA